MKYIFSAILILGLLSGCTPSTTYEAPSEKWDVWSPPPPYLEINLTLSESVLSKHQGQSLQMNLGIKNISPDSVLFEIGGDPNRPYYEFVVTLPDTTLVWSRLRDEDRDLDLSAFGKYLAPGEKITYQHTWQLNYPDGPRVPKGLYRIYGGLRCYITTEPGGEVIHGPFATGPEIVTVH